MNKPVRQYAPDQADTSASGSDQPADESHADNYKPEQTADRNVPEDGPSGENTKNNGEQGGGLWTSGGQVTTGTPYHGEYGTPEPNREATPKKEE
ncbi:hypothetical protein [Spirosoma taeanense]|nr:hypothetical protein [Spirosoma taeanense]